MTYHYRQAYIHQGLSLSYGEVFHQIKHLDCYKALPRKVSNSILILIDNNWRSFRNGMKAWYEDPAKFTGRPHLPGYKHKEKGRNILVYDKQALGKRAFKKTGKLVPSGLPIEIETRVAWDQIDQVRIVPRGSCYVLEVVYRRAEQQAAVDPCLMAAIDLGVNVLAAITSTSLDSPPFSSTVALSKTSITSTTSNAPKIFAASPSIAAKQAATWIGSR